MDIFAVSLSKKAKNDLKKLPTPIVFKLQLWIDGVRTHGLNEIRKRPGFHDEPLKGQREGQRSIRLNRAYRAIYEIDETGTIHFIEVLEVTKHGY
jgi:proteic killer suppression protein